MTRIPRGSRGQAGAEYIAILLVVGAVLAGAAAVAAAVSGVGDRVVGTIRTGICIVGGDLCRTADAAAAGLPPCLTRERGDRQDTDIDIAIVRLGGHGEWQLALRSDGSAVVTRLEENEAGGSAGVGVSFSPAGLDASASVTLTAGYRSGRAWRFDSAAEARAFLDGARRDADVSAEPRARRALGRPRGHRRRRGGRGARRARGARRRGLGGRGPRAAARRRHPDRDRRHRQ